MYSIGIVQSIDVEKLLVKVKFNLKDIVAYNLRILQQFTGRNKTFWLPDINEMVVCILDEGRQTGVILGSIYSADTSTGQNNLPEGIANVDKTNAVFYRSFDDGTYIKYDRVNKKLTIDVKADIDETIGNDGKTADDEESKGKITRVYKKDVKETYEAKKGSIYNEEVKNTYEKIVTNIYKDEIKNTYEKKQTGTYNDEKTETFEKAVTKKYNDKLKTGIDKDLTIEVKGNAEIKVTGSVKIEAASVELGGKTNVKITGGVVSINNCLEVAG